MRTRVSAALAGVFVVAMAFAQSFTEDNADKVGEIVAAAVKAHGGDRLADLRTLYIEQQGVNYAVRQSRGTEPPWDASDTDGFDAIDLENSRFVTEASFTGGGFEGRNGTVINGDESYQLDFRAGTSTKIDEPDFAAASGPFVRVTPALLVRTLEERAANAHYLGQVTVDDATYDAIGFSMTVGPAITLYFDSKTHLLQRSERIFAGAGLVQYEFSDYEPVDGIPFNRTFRLYLSGELNTERTLDGISVNGSLDDYLTVDEQLAAVPAAGPEPLTRQEIDDGVWLVGGAGTYAMIVDMGDYLFAAGGTAGIPDRIASVREVAGDKPIKYGMLTHHHFDHVVGVSAYEAEGATLLTAVAHETTAREAASEPERLDVLPVADRMTLESGGRVIEIVDIGPTAHTEHLLVAYLPEQGILFEADHFALPRVGPIPPAVTSTRSFAEALSRHGLRATRIVSSHSPKVATMDDLQTALEKEAFAAIR